MQVISIPDFCDAIHYVSYLNREPIMAWGKPGVGKSDGVRSAVKRILDMLGITFTGKHFHAQGSDRLVDIRLSQYASVDLRGMPTIEEAIDGALTTWCKPSTMPFKGNARYKEDNIPIFLFLDEINSAQNSVAAVAYQLVNDKRIGEHELMDNVVIVAAGNREQDKGITNRMPTPLANRFTHFEVDVDVNAWCYWAQDKGLPPEGIAFMQFRQPLLCTFDPGKPDKAFATPRSWEKALKYYADPRIPEHTKQQSMAGAVGEGPAAEFWGFVDVWAKMPKMSDIEKSPTTVPVPDAAAMRYAVAVAISGTMEPKNTGPFNIYLERMDPEFGVLAWQLAIKRNKMITASQDFISFSKKYRAIFA